MRLEYVVAENSFDNFLKTDISSFLTVRLSRAQGKLAIEWWAFMERRVAEKARSDRMRRERERERERENHRSVLKMRARGEIIGKKESLVHFSQILRRVSCFRLFSNALVLKNSIPGIPRRRR